jgi:hypothetical protein
VTAVRAVSCAHTAVRVLTCQLDSSLFGLCSAMCSEERLSALHQLSVSSGVKFTPDSSTKLR